MPRLIIRIFIHSLAQSVQSNSATNALQPYYPHPEYYPQYILLAAPR